MKNSKKNPRRGILLKTITFGTLSMVTGISGALAEKTVADLTEGTVMIDGVVYAQHKLDIYSATNAEAYKNGTPLKSDQWQQFLDDLKAGDPLALAYLRDNMPGYMADPSKAVDITTTLNDVLEDPSKYGMTEVDAMNLLKGAFEEFLDVPAAQRGKADFSKIDLTKYDIKGKDLRNTGITTAQIQPIQDLQGTILSGLTLNGLDAKGKNLYGTDFTGTFLSGSDFEGQDLTNTIFEKTDLTNANLKDTNLDKNDMKNSTLTNAKLNGATLTGTDFTGSTMDLADMTGADLTDATLDKADLTGAIMTDAILTNTSLKETDLTGSNLAANQVLQAKPDLTKTTLPKIDFSNKDLSGLTLNETNFSKSNLTNAKLPDNILNTNLTGANLTGVSLANKTLTGTKLIDATLTNVTATGADFTGVDFTGAVTTDAIFDGAILSQSGATGAILNPAASYAGAKIPRTVTAPNDPLAGREGTLVSSWNTAADPLNMDGTGDYLEFLPGGAAVAGPVTIAAAFEMDPNYSSDPNNYVRLISGKTEWTDASGYELEYNPATQRITFGGSGMQQLVGYGIDLNSGVNVVAVTLEDAGGGQYTPTLYVNGSALPMSTNPQNSQGIYVTSHTNPNGTRNWTQPQTTTTMNGVTPSTATVTVGKHASDPGSGRVPSIPHYFDGNMVDTRAYNTALTPAEIAAYSNWLLSNQ